MKYIKKFENKKVEDIFDAVMHHDIELVKKLINNGVDLNIKDNDGYTPLMRSMFVIEDSEKIIKLLIDAGANVNITDDNNGNTALILWIKSDWKNTSTNKIKLLINAGADVNIKNNYGNTALILASSRNQIENVKLLIEAGADWNLKNDEDSDFLDYLSNNNVIIELYPDQYKEYLIKKDAEKYNL